MSLPSPNLIGFFSKLPMSLFTICKLELASPPILGITDLSDPAIKRKNKILKTSQQTLHCALRLIKGQTKNIDQLMAYWCSNVGSQVDVRPTLSMFVAPSSFKSFPRTASPAIKSSHSLNPRFSANSISGSISLSRIGIGSPPPHTLSSSSFSPSLFPPPSPTRSLSGTFSTHRRLTSSKTNPIIIKLLMSRTWFRSLCSTCNSLSTTNLAIDLKNNDRCMS
ncbi:hypothetical protein Scep_028092 [Stephania cephalantha]|uniref:Uncharacterized protein n=1 Tax=Stephania cephalantha TaxID=152367 RepID=A0AAP0HN55_9MAGN